MTYSGDGAAYTLEVLYAEPGDEGEEPENPENPDEPEEPGEEFKLELGENTIIITGEDEDGFTGEFSTTYVFDKSGSYTFSISGSGVYYAYVDIWDENGDLLETNPDVEWDESTLYGEYGKTTVTIDINADETYYFYFGSTNVEENIEYTFTITYNGPNEE